MSLEEDGFKSTVDRVGHGLQRAFILSLLQNLVSFQSSSQRSGEETTGEGQEEETPDLILAIEEPELYQHPNRQRHLARVLLQLSKGEIAGVARATQVVYCTHSPLFVGLDRFSSIRRLSKVENSHDHSLPRITDVASITLGQVASQLEAAQTKKPSVSFTAESLLPRMTALMTPMVNEGFFGDVVVLVEGEDDRCAILGAASQMGRDLESLGVAVIPCSGKTSLDRPLLVFRGLRIPVFVIFDGDASKEKHVKANRILQTLLAVESPKDFPQTQVTASFAVFENNLDEHIQERVGTVLYGETVQQFYVEYGYSNEAQCKKSPLFVKTVLAKAAEKDVVIEELKQIVENVVALIPNL